MLSLFNGIRCYKRFLRLDIPSSLLHKNNQHLRNRCYCGQLCHYNEIMHNQSHNPCQSINNKSLNSIDRQARRLYSSSGIILKNTVPITYVESDGTKKTVDAEIGKNLMDIAHENNVDLEGACGGELACSTCHLIFEEDIYKTLPEKEEAEIDMLDLAIEVTETSRLGCQIICRENFAGMKVRIPDDGF